MRILKKDLTAIKH